MALCLGFIALCTGPSFCQDQYRIFAPTKDVAMLVDVSVSVKKDAEGHEEARKIIQSIVSGEGLGGNGLKANWTIDSNPEMAGLFGAYLGLPGSAESAELRPLMEVNNSFLSMHIGTVETVLTQGQYRRLRKPDEIKELVTGGYPGIKDMDDKSTCFWLGMARAAGTLTQNSKLGYYLFVVSDEEDDPDYRKDGPPGHTASDYLSYTKGLAKTYPETAIRAEIARYFDYKGTNSRNVDLYQPRGDFKQVLIAKFTHTAYREAKSRVKIAWYAMGVVPQRVHVPRVIQPPEPVPVAAAPLDYQPPRLEASLQWLGGLEQTPRKTFNYGTPLLVWQVRNADLAGRSEDGRPSLQIASRTRPVKKLPSSPRHVLQTAALPNEIEDGSMNVSVRVDDLESEEARIEIRRPTLARLQIFAWVSAILALLVFLLSWRSLRQAPTQRAKSQSHA
jgi:hypothetical protein